MKKNHPASASLLAIALVLCGCATHYQPAGITRQRVVIDSRFDQNPDPKVAAFLTPYKQKVDSLMGPVVGTVAHDMAADRPESDLSNLLADIMLWAAKDYGEHPDFGVYNVGGIRAALSKGNVTYGDVLDVAPFENKICFVTLKGDKVTELFRQMARRGGEGVSHGVELVIGRDGRLVSAQLNGQPIDPDRQYRIATIDYLAQGNDDLEAFKAGTGLNSPQEEKNNSRFIIMDYFRSMHAQGKSVDAKVEGRIRLAEQ